MIKNEPAIRADIPGNYRKLLVPLSANPCVVFRFRAEAGGADRDRTGDLLLAKQALSQLSYSPGDDDAPQLPAATNGGPGKT